MQNFKFKNLKIRKTLKVVLILLLVFSFIFLVACGKKTEESSKTNKSTESAQSQQIQKQKDSKTDKKKSQDPTKDKSSKTDKSNNTKTSKESKAASQSASNTSKQNTSKQNTSSNNSSSSKAQQPARAPAANNPPAPAPAPAKEETVSISIIGPPGVGTVLGGTNIKYENNDTALDALVKITREKKIHMEYSGARGAAYIEGINNNYEFDHGPKSGWVYRVNGSKPNQSVGAYNLKPGDRIEFLYTTDLGNEF